MDIGSVILLVVLQRAILVPTFPMRKASRIELVLLDAVLFCTSEEEPRRAELLFLFFGGLAAAWAKPANETAHGEISIAGILLW